LTQFTEKELHNPEGPFQTKEIYKYEDEFRKVYPNNQYVTDKIRQQLQYLRDIGLLRNPKKGLWVKQEIMDGN